MLTVMYRSVHVYRSEAEKEEMEEREYLLRETSNFVETRCAPVITLHKFDVPAQSVGNLNGVWKCMFVYDSDRDKSTIVDASPEWISIAENPKMEFLPTLANDLLAISELALNVEFGESSGRSTTEESGGNNIKIHQTEKKSPVPFLDLNSLPGSDSETEENDQNVSGEETITLRPSMCCFAFLFYGSSENNNSAEDQSETGDAKPALLWSVLYTQELAKVAAIPFYTLFCFCTVSTRAHVLLPRPLESNVVLDVHHIACGVKHAALVTRQGEIFTWDEESGGRLGDGVGKDVTQPLFVESLSFCSIDFVACGPLEGLQVASVTCGPWHTALITSTGQLFTFGDGTFGVLGHGDRENVLFPREVKSLSGVRTIAAACGVWHTAAVVEVIVTQSSTSVSSGKLFTGGDGDKNRLGHGDKEPRLEPTCVPALIDYNFHKIACGHSLTVCLTTSGLVFTMGSTVYGQLGNPYSGGKLPCLVEYNLSGESVEDIACGSYHAAVLTSKNEVYTWGKGVNGRLGHGDVEDRKTPTLVESLKDRHVKYIACGSNYTAAMSSQMGFWRSAGPRLSGENKDSYSKAVEQGKNADTFSLGRSSQAPLIQLKDVVLSTGDLRWAVPKPVMTQSGVSSRSVSPFSRKPSPPRSATPVPTTAGLSFSKSIADSLKKTNELLNQEVHKLQAQLKDMAERLPPGAYDVESLKLAYLPNGLDANGIHYPDTNGERHSRSDSVASSYMASQTNMDFNTYGMQSPSRYQRDSSSIEAITSNQILTYNGTDDRAEVRLPNGSGAQVSINIASEAVDNDDTSSLQDNGNGLKSRNSLPPGNPNPIN
ncbi:hypothetical protein K7X08_026680 [Anisodus acutangulus]|uniref:RCC1-like domain-containing protein n=1 Tax=Anisodus acutangulus TaxID=402998 RepID=A0A9Q1LBC8_9SOLA|nr:hypothetical protein K7X08_026680 [Anisodus acutangulus]